MATLEVWGGHILVASALFLLVATIGIGVWELGVYASRHILDSCEFPGCDNRRDRRRFTCNDCGLRYCGAHCRSVMLAVEDGNYTGRKIERRSLCNLCEASRAELQNVSEIRAGLIK